MKKTLSIILSFVMLVTSIVCIFTNGFVASAAVGYSEDFESYTVGTDMAADDALAWKVYDEGENGYFKGTPGTNGWMAGAKATTLLVSDTKATTTGGKSLALAGWSSAFKEVSVQPGNIYTLTFKFYANAVKDKDFAIYDVSNVTADGYSFKAYTAFEPVAAANKIQRYDKTLLTTLAYERNKSYAADTWTEYTATFTATEGMSKILIAFSYEGSSGNVMYIDDISLTYVKDTESNAIFKDGSFEIASALTAGTKAEGANGVRASEWKNNKPSINANGWVGSHYGNGNILLGNTTYATSAGNFTTPAAKDGSHLMRLTTEWHTVAKVVNVEAGKDYALTYWYYADNADAKFMDSMDFAIGLSANATTVTIPVTKYEADGVTIKDCGGDILADGTDGQTKILYTPKSGDNKNAVGVWTQRTLYFNSGTFTKIAIPFYHKKHNVYIDNVSIVEQKQISVNVTVSGADNNDAGSASAVLTDDNKFLYTATPFKNAEFLGWYDGDTLVNSNTSFELSFEEAKNLTAKFKSLYTNDFDGGYVDNLTTGTNLADGYAVVGSSEQVSGSWKYTFTSTPATNGWFFSMKDKSATVVEKANLTNAVNKAIEIKAWDKVGKLIEVKPYHRYTFTYDYYLPTNAEFGNFNIYDASGVTDNKYVGRSDTAPAGTFSNELMWATSGITSIPAIGSNFYRSSAKSGAETHELWKTRTLTFETGADITRILLTWAPEGSGAIYLDNLELTSRIIPQVDVTITGEDNKNAGGAVATLNDEGTEITFVATAYKNSVFKGWYRNNQLVSADAKYVEAYNGTYEKLEARFECTYVNEFTGDSGFENSAFNENVVEGQTIANTSENINGTWKYTFTSTPNANGWFTQQAAHNNQPVVELANSFNAANKALKVSAWAKLGRVVEVKPNHKYTFSFDFYQPTGNEWGNFNIYNVSNITNNSYIGYDTIDNSISNQYMWVDTNKNKLPEMGNNFLRSSAKQDGVDKDGNPVDTHDVWRTHTVEFATDSNTTKILITWSPEGNQPLYLDNITLTGLFVPPVDVTVTGKNDPSSASAYAVVNDAKTEIKFVAKNFPNSEFLGWYRNDQLVSTDVVYTESFNGNAASYEKMEARFNCKYINEFQDGYIDTLETDSNIVAEQTNNVVDQQELPNGKWIYNRNTIPGANGWMTSMKGNVPVTELTDGNGDINKVLKVSSWQHLARVIDVKPNHKYTFTFDYYIPSGAEFGHFNVLNVSSVTNNTYVGTWDIDCPYDATSLRKQYAWFDSTFNKFPEMGNNYYKSSAKNDTGVPGEEGYVDSHDTWITRTATFTTDANTTKILITFAPEGSGEVYYDNFTLTSEFVPSISVVTTGADTANAGGASAKLSDTKDSIIYSAFTYVNGEFLGWYRNDNLVSSALTYTESFDGNVDTYVALEARFNCLYKNEFTGDSGFENTMLDTEITKGGITEDQNGLKYRIVAGYSSATYDGVERAEIVAQILRDNGFNVKVLKKQFGENKYNVVAISPADDGTKQAALNVLSTVTSEVPAGTDDKVVLGYLTTSTNALAKVEMAKADLALKGISAVTSTLVAGDKQYYVVSLETNDATAKQAAIDALSTANSELPSTYDEYLYTFYSTPNADGWLKHAGGDRNVVEKATNTNPTNRALKINAWAKTGRILTVQPNTEYELSFDYFSPLMLEFGTVAIYDITNVSSETLCARDDIDGLINLFKDINDEEFATLSFYRSAGSAHATNPELHDKWDSFRAKFTTKVATNKILIVWYPEGRGALYIDNVVLAGSELNFPITPKADDAQAEMGGVYPDTGYIPVGKSEEILTFMASPVAGNKFVKWQLNGVDVAGAAGTNPVYTGTFAKDTVLTPVFEKIGAGNIVANPGAEQYANNTNMLDNKNNPDKDGSWFAVWSTDGSDGNGYSAKYLEQKEDGTPQPPQKFWTLVSTTNEEARSGNNSFKFEKMNYQILGRNITGLKKNTRYLLSFWVKFTSDSAYLDFVSIVNKSAKDEMWQDGECDSSKLNTVDIGGKSIANLNKSQGTLKLNGTVSGWQKVSLAFNTGDDTAVAVTLQTVDSKGKATAFYVDDMGVEEIAESTELVSATATYDIGGTAQTSAGNGFVKPGELTMFLAIPRSDITFDGWYKPGTTTNPLSTSQYHVVNLDTNLTLQARFNAIEVGLQSYQLGGYATVDKTGVWPDGTAVTFTATVDEGNTFAGWYDASTEQLVSRDLVYTDNHYDTVILIAKFDGYNKPAREVLGLNGFENYAVDTELKETWLSSIINYQIYADGSTDNSWTKFRVSDWRAYSGKKALSCINRWRFTRLELDGLNKNTTYKISFKYHMAEEDETALMYTYVGPTGFEVPDQSQIKSQMYFYDETGVRGGRGWDTYELYFNSGDLSTLEFGIKFEATTPLFSGDEAYKNPYSTDQSYLYIDDLEIWEYAANAEIVSSDFSGDNNAWLSQGNKATFNKEASIPASSTMYQYVNVTPFTQYLFTFEANSSDLSAGILGVEYNSVNSISKISSIAGADISNNAKNKYTIAFTTGNEESVAIAFTNNSSSAAKVDNVKLTVDTVGYSEGVIEKVDFETERFDVNNFSINDPKKEHILKCVNEAPFQNEGFEIYTATSSTDKNVLNGNKSLKILPQDDDEVAHKLWQTWMNFPTKKLNGNYLITFNYKFENADGGAVYLAGDAKDIYVQEHTIYAQDNKWHTAYFSIDNTEGLIFLKAAVGTIAGEADSAIYIDDITFQLHPSMITEATTRYTYTEGLYNRVENNSFEEKITKDDWSGMPKEYSIVKGDAFTKDKYLKAGVSSKVYTKIIEVDPSQAYYVGISLRGKAGTKGTVSLMSTNVSGNNVLFKDADKTVNSTFTYKGSGDWERQGFKFVTPSNGKLSIVIDTRKGAIDIDNIMIFPIKFKYTYDPNDYFDYQPYDFSDMSNAIINGGVGEQPYYDGDLSVGRDKDPYAASGSNTLVYNPTHTDNTLVNVITLTLSMLVALAAVAYLIVKNKKREVK